jgi:hypothetical protein
VRVRSIPATWDAFEVDGINPISSTMARNIGSFFILK